MSFDFVRELDRVKAKAFMNKNSAFLAPILCNMRFEWTDRILTAETDGVDLRWNPNWFQKMVMGARVTVLLHEIWHIARLHSLRRGSRDPLWWNYACDIWINNMLEGENNSFEGIENCWKDQQYRGLVEEEIYDRIYNPNNKQTPPPTGSFGDDGGAGDLGNQGQEISNQQKQELLSVVTMAAHSAKMSSFPGSIPGDTEQILTQFLKPVVPWQQLLHRFFNDMLTTDYTWRRPNRRFDDIYLPSTYQDDGRLEHLMYFMDVSGSITQKDLLRFNSEVKYVWDEYQPQKMSLVQFDTRISHEQVIKDGDVLTEMVVKGGGGTSLVPVREHIIKHRPTAAIIFSDMEVEPMAKLPFEVPIIWVVLGGRRSHKPSFGDVIVIPSGSV